MAIRAGTALRRAHRTAPALVAMGILLAVPGPAAAQQAFPVADVRFETSAIGFSTDRIAFPVDRIAFPAEPIAFPVQDMSAPVARSKSEVKFALQGDVMFDFDKANIRPEAEEILAKLARQIKESYKRGTVRVEGHTDSKGSQSYNKTLSERRASSVKRWFVEKGGLRANRLSARGFGESQPVAPNTKDGKDYPEGRQMNRRVEIIVRP